MTQEEWIALGFNSHVAEALAENEKTREDVATMSSDEIFDLFLTWNGIMGFTSMITNALDNVRNMEAVDI